MKLLMSHLSEQLDPTVQRGNRRDQEVIFLSIALCFILSNCVLGRTVWGVRVSVSETYIVSAFPSLSFNLPLIVKSRYWLHELP